jgi:hypothetical protein
LHPSLSHQKGLNPRDDFREAGCAIFEGSLAIVGAPDPVETDGDSELMPLEKIAIFRCEQRSIRRDRKPNVNARGSRQSSCVFGRGSEARSIRQRLAAEKGEVDACSAFGPLKQQIDCAQRLLDGHGLRTAAETTLLRIAIGAAKIAFLCDCQRKRA